MVCTYRAERWNNQEGTGKHFGMNDTESLNNIFRNCCCEIDFTVMAAALTTKQCQSKRTNTRLRECLD